ncbi:MAG: PQQ-dependent sugar dehydrogenase [Gemmatimonadales bacterium]
MKWLAVLLCLACGDGFRPPPPPPSPPPPPPPPPVSLELISADLTDPVYATAPPGDPTRLFVVEQGGRIRIFRNDTLLPGAFLDLQGRITSGGEQGLLSLAFHPQYETNSRAYVYFTDPQGDTRVVRYQVSAADPNVLDETTADTVLAVDQPFTNHNGGLLLFGPDGMLYVGLGDGGSGGDPRDNAENPHVLLGKLLRLDVDGLSGYAIPPDNPFASGVDGAPEIWALGLRNPWRFAFHPQTGDLYIADVGQGLWEEVNVSPATGGQGAGRGLNYGWDIMEGRHCFEPSTSCDQTGLTLPLVEYNHGGVACSVTGGFVYNSTRVAALTGHYIYADFCAGFVRSFRFVDGQATDETDWTTRLSPGTQISSFGQDAAGELYIMTLPGTLHRIVEGN